MKDAKATFKNWLLPHKREKEYQDWLLEKDNTRRIKEYKELKAKKFEEKYWNEKRREVSQLIALQSVI
jgi:hypothetical protein